jgi:flagellar motor switch protein FliN/FliY
MSDGSLSQDEIDALLMGNDSLGGSDAGGDAAGGAGLAPDLIQALNGLFGNVAGTLSATMTGIMSTAVTIGAPEISSLSRDDVMGQLSDEVVEVKMDFNQGLSGGHTFLFSPENAVKIAGPMIGQSDVELDGTAISAVGEAVSQLTGAEVTTIGDTVGDNIMTISPESQKVAKGLISVGGDSLVQLKYPVTIDGQGPLEMIEILELPVAQSLADKLGSSGGAAADMMAGLGDMGGVQQPMDNGMGMPQQPMGGMGMPQQQMGGMGMPQQQMGGMGMPQQQMGGMGMPMQQMNPYMTPQQAPNVQGVQFPEFSTNISPSEQRNIGLLMDVSMELTVELGRTKWQIKDILGIGEGTIIELDKLAGEPVDILVNNNLIAKGEVVVIDENFGVRVTDIVSNLDRVGEN